MKDLAITKEERKKIRKCKRCSSEYNLRNCLYFIPYCVNCRKYKLCPICNQEFHHKQNLTCSQRCAEEMKKQTYIASTGKEHNFCKESKTRDNFEKKMLADHGVTNQFQRSEIKEKLKETWIFNYGVDNPSKSEIIKTRKRITLSKTLEKNPQLFKQNWKKVHDKFIETFGYDPRLVSLSYTSKESLLYFFPLIEKLEESNFKYYIGIEGNREFCISVKGEQSYFYDLCIPSLNLIVEYNGVVWHAKKGDTEWKHPITKQNYTDNLLYFEKKKKAAEDRGFEVMIIWSDDPQKNKVIENLKTKIDENKIGKKNNS